MHVYAKVVELNLVDAQQTYILNAITIGKQRSSVSRRFRRLQLSLSNIREMLPLMTCFLGVIFKYLEWSIAT